MLYNNLIHLYQNDKYPQQDLLNNKAYLNSLKKYMV
jgi:hypothetical protein